MMCLGECWSSGFGLETFYLSGTFQITPLNESLIRRTAFDVNNKRNERRFLFLKKVDKPYFAGPDYDYII